MRLEFTLIVGGIMGVLFNGYQYWIFRKSQRDNAQSEGMSQFIEYNSSIFGCR